MGVRAAAAAAMRVSVAIVIASALAGCGGEGRVDTVTQPARSSEVAQPQRDTWDEAALRRALPGLVTVLRHDEVGTDDEVRVVSAEGTPAVTVWSADGEISECSGACDVSNGRIALVEVEGRGTRSESQWVVVLETGGSVRRALLPTSTGTVTSMTFASDGDLLLLARSASSAGETAWAFRLTPAWRLSPVRMVGTWPRHVRMASLTAMPSDSVVAVLLETGGDSTADRGYAAVLADYTAGLLRVRPGVVQDRGLYLIGVGDRADTIFFARSARHPPPRGEPIDVVFARFAGGEPVIKALAPAARGVHADVGALPMVGEGPGRNALIRVSAGGPSEGQPDRLDAISLTTGMRAPTNMRLAAEGERWTWLESFGASE